MSDFNLPEEWIEEALGELADQITKGTTPTTAGHSYKSEGIPFIKVENIDEHGINLKSVVQFIDEKAHTELLRSQFQVNDVLFSIAGTIGKTAIVKKEHLPANTNQAVAIIRGVTNFFEPIFLKLQLKEAALRIAKENARGGAMNNISLGDLKGVLVSLPPLAEQQQIAQKLDELLAQVDTLKTRLDAIPKILKRFRQSVLTAAVSGRLTEEWRGSGEYEDGFPLVWQKKGLSEIGSLARGKSKHRPRNDARLFGNEYPFIQTGEVANCDGKIRSATRFYSEFGLQQSKLFPIGTLCITIAANIADTAILDIDACFPDSIVGFTPNSKACLVEFVKFLVDVNKDNLEAFAPATAQKNINLKILNEMRLPLPSIEEQTEIVRRVEQLFAYADQIEQRVKDAQARVNHLTHSILAKAFRGELTAEWRAQNPELISGENSAAALLERIKAEREAIKPKKKVREKRQR